MTLPDPNVPKNAYEKAKRAEDLTEWAADAKEEQERARIRDKTNEPTRNV